MDEGQTLFEHLTLSDFKKWSSAALNTFNNSIIIMTSNSDKIIISCVFVSVPYIQVNSTGSSGKFQVIFKHFQNQKKSYFQHFEGQIPFILPCGLYHLFQNQRAHFLVPLFFEKNLNRQVRINKTGNKHTVDYLPSPSKLTSRIHPLIFLWTPKRFISPEYFLKFYESFIKSIEFYLFRYKCWLNNLSAI